MHMRTLNNTELGGGDQARFCNVNAEIMHSRKSLSPICTFFPLYFFLAIFIHFLGDVSPYRAQDRRPCP